MLPFPVFPGDEHQTILNVIVLWKRYFDRTRITEPGDFLGISACLALKLTGNFPQMCACGEEGKDIPAERTQRYESPRS
jgi:hypothetical protein